MWKTGRCLFVSSYIVGVASLLSNGGSDNSIPVTGVLNTTPSGQQLTSIAGDEDDRSTFLYVENEDHKFIGVFGTGIYERIRLSQNTDLVCEKGVSNTLTFYKLNVIRVEGDPVVVYPSRRDCVSTQYVEYVTIGTNCYKITRRNGKNALALALLATPINDDVCLKSMDLLLALEMLQSFMTVMWGESSAWKSHSMVINIAWTGSLSKPKNLANYRGKTLREVLKDIAEQAGLTLNIRDGEIFMEEKDSKLDKDNMIRLRLQRLR